MRFRMASDAFGEADADVKPVVQPGGSDSAALDNVLEVLVRGGRSAPSREIIAGAGSMGEIVDDAAGPSRALCVLERGDGAVGRARCARDL